MSRLLGDEYAAFAAALEGKPVSGLRVNTLKLTAHQFQAISPFFLGNLVPWCDSAFIIPISDFSFGKHPYHLAGLYYLQDPSAMSAAALLDPQPGERVLDLAAAPGGKTTHLAALMQGRGLLVANEIKDKRVGHLAVNVERWCAGNVVITNESPERLADHFGDYFDRVLVDAPCSGEGMFRKDMGARADWSPEMVAGCAVRQGNILRVAAKLVRLGGYLMYSTCTFAPEEDEEVINGLLNGQADGKGLPEFEVVPLPILDGFMSGRPDWLKEKTKNKKQKDDLHGAVRLFPHRVMGEGHFVCMMKRVGGTENRLRTAAGSDRLPNPSSVQMMFWREFSQAVLSVDFPEDRYRVRGDRLYLVPEDMPDFGHLRVIHPGVWFGNFKKDRFEPAHPLALFLRPGQAKNVLDLSSEVSGSRSPLQKYLGGETIPSDGPSGWTLVTVDDWPLGWGKRVQGAVKNHYPKGWQIYS
jgi:NOL1/NOP2/sun family putative RNA methylase